MADTGRAARGASSAWDDFLEPDPPPSDPEPVVRTGPFRPGPLGLLVWVLVAGALGFAGGVAWYASDEEVVTVVDGALSTLAPGVEADEREAWAIAQVAGLSRSDGTTFAEWVKGTVDDQRCLPDQPGSAWTWVVHEDGLAPDLSWRVGLRRVTAPDAVCTAAWDRVWLAQVGASDGVVREIVCTGGLAPACPGRLADGPLPAEPVNAVVDWLDEFATGA